jgi:hypothetical protein
MSIIIVKPRPFARESNWLSVIMTVNGGVESVERVQNQCHEMKP